MRLFVEQGHNIILAQSFAKVCDSMCKITICTITDSICQNFGLYGERVGTLSVVTSSKEEADAVGSQVRHRE